MSFIKKYLVFSICWAFGGSAQDYLFLVVVFGVFVVAFIAVVLLPVIIVDVFCCC